MGEAQPDAPHKGNFFLGLMERWNDQVHPPPSLHMTWSALNVNQEPCQKWCWRRNGYAIFLKCFPKIDLLLFLQIAQKGNASHHIHMN
jgi:hypothetical protein